MESFVIGGVPEIPELPERVVEMDDIALPLHRNNVGIEPMSFHLRNLEIARNLIGRRSRRSSVVRAQDGSTAIFLKPMVIPL
jgi:hypothetical protein